MKTSKKLIVVPEPILEELMYIAKRNGLTISELTTLILSHAAHMLRNETNISNIFKETILVSSTRKLGGIIIPVSVLGTIFSEADSNVENKILTNMASFIKVTVLYLREHTSNNLNIQDILSLFLPRTTIDVIEENGSAKLIIYVNDKRLNNYVKRIAEEIIKVWGYEITRIDQQGDLIIIKYRARQ